MNASYRNVLEGTSRASRYAERELKQQEYEVGVTLGPPMTDFWRGKKIALQRAKTQKYAREM